MRRELAAMLSLATACLHHGPAFCPSRTKVLHRRGGAAMPAASLAWQVWRVLATMLPRTCRLHGPVPCTNQAEIRGRGRHATLRLAWLERRAMVPMSLRACLHHYPASCWGWCRRCIARAGTPSWLCEVGDATGDQVAVSVPTTAQVSCLSQATARLFCTQGRGATLFARRPARPARGNCAGSTCRGLSRGVGVASPHRVSPPRPTSACIVGRCMVHVHPHTAGATARHFCCAQRLQSSGVAWREAATPMPASW